MATINAARRESVRRRMAREGSTRRNDSTQNRAVALHPTLWTLATTRRRVALRERVIDGVERQSPNVLAGAVKRALRSAWRPAQGRKSPLRDGSGAVTNMRVTKTRGNGGRALMSWTLLRSGAVGALLAAGGSVAHAGAAELSLEQSGSCVNLDELSFRVARALGQPLEEAGEAKFGVRIEATRAGYHAHVEARDGTGQALAGARALEARSCEELTEALALAVALAIGQHSTPRESVPSAASPVSSTEPAVAADTPDAPPSAAIASDSRVTGPALAGSAWAIGDTGTLPGLGLGAGLGVELRWPSFALRALGTLLPEREGTLQAPLPSNRGVSIGLLAAGVLACVPIAVSPVVLKLAVCTGAELGELSGSGIGVSTPHHQRTLWSAVRFDADLRWALPDMPLGLDLLVTAAAPLSRDEFVLRNIGSVHRPASVVGRVGLGLSLLIN